MKKSIFLIASLSMFLQANEMDDAIREHLRQNYQKSYDMFLQLFKKDTGNPEVNFYLGLNAIESKKYEEALAAFERALIIDPKSVRNRLEYAKTLCLMQMFDISKDEFEKIKKESIPKEVSDNIDKYLEQIEAARKKNLLIGVFQVGYIHDNNLNNTVDNNLVYIPSQGISSNQDTNKKQDTSHTELVFIGHNYDFGEKDGFLLKSQGVLYNQGYSASKDKNIVFAQLATGPAYIDGKHQSQVLVNYDRVLIAGENLFRVDSPEYTYAFTENFNAGGGLKIQKKEHTAGENSDKDSLGYETFLKSSYKITSEDIVQLGYSYGKDDRVRGDRTDVNLLVKNYKISYTKDVTKELKGTLSYALKTSEYKQQDANFLINRMDEYQNVGVSLLYSFNPLAQLGLSFNKIVNHSNIDTNDYKKETVGINFTKIFMSSF